MTYWLIKSEPDVYSIDNLKKDKITYWDGVRNYQARNFLKSMEKGRYSPILSFKCRPNWGGRNCYSRKGGFS